MSEKNERLQILEMIENGTITASEGASLLKALEADYMVEDMSFDSEDEPEPFVTDEAGYSKGNEPAAEPLSGKAGNEGC